MQSSVQLIYYTHLFRMLTRLTHRPLLTRWLGGWRSRKCLVEKDRTESLEEVLCRNHYKLWKSIVT